MLSCALGRVHGGFSAAALGGDARLARLGLAALSKPTGSSGLTRKLGVGLEVVGVGVEDARRGA